MPEEFLRVRNVKKAFGRKLVLAGVDLDVKKGEVLGIIGASGSGKTTLLHTIIGFLKPDQGEVHILIDPGHRALSSATYKEVSGNLHAAKQVYGFASQSPSFYDTLTVEENLLYFGSLYDLHSSTVKTNRDLLLRLMDLEPARKTLAKNLSGGMERRLDIACALIHDPAILILDEPTADLDPVLRSHIYDLISKINAKDTTIILASHHLSDLERVCDRIAILKDGRILALGTADEIKDRFSDNHQIIAKLASNSEKKLLEELKRKDPSLAIKPTIDHRGLSFLTAQPQEAIKAILSFTKEDRLETLHVGKPSLDEIFIEIAESSTSEASPAPSSKTKERKAAREKQEPRARDQEKKPKSVRERPKETLFDDGIIFASDEKAESRPARKIRGNGQ